MKVAMIQMCSKLDYKENLTKIDNFIIEAKKEQADIEAVFLPEVFYSMSDGTVPTPYLIDGENEHFSNIQNIAKKHNVYLLGGSCATRLNDQVVNRSYNFAPSGELIGEYDKIHLFKIDLSRHEKGKTVVDETAVYSGGDRSLIIDINEWKMGVSICFDVRFPELFRHYYSQGANLFTLSSAFTVPTGKAHWETLVRSRAIENQSYIIATDQWGEHNDKIKTYGHSMIVDPWGDIIAQIKEGEGYAIASLSIDRVNQIRSRVDIRPQKRLDYI